METTEKRQYGDMSDDEIRAEVLRICKSSRNMWEAERRIRDGLGYPDHLVDKITIIRGYYGNTVFGTINGPRGIIEL